MKKHGYRANEISKLRKIDFIQLIKDKEESGLKHLKKIIDTEFAKREKEASRNLHSGYKRDQSSIKKLNQSHDHFDNTSHWDDTFDQMQKNLDDAHQNISHANSYLLQSKNNINRIDLKSVQTVRNTPISNQSRISTLNNNLKLGLKNNDDHYLTHSTAFNTN